MSHFTVLVIGDDVEGQLAPFQENNMGDCPEEYLEFRDDTDDFKNQYETDGVSKIKYKGKIYNRHDKAAKDPETDEHYADAEVFTSLFKDDYSSFEKWAVDWANLEPTIIDGETKYGYHVNPNAKWDGYQIGGRWAGFFRIKEGVVYSEDNLPNFSWGWETKDKLETIKERRVDQAKKKDIDFVAMKDDIRKDAEKQYDGLAKVFGGDIPKLDFTWKELVAKLKKEGGKDYGKARLDYNNQVAIKKLNKLTKELFWDVRESNKEKAEEYKFLLGLDLDLYQNDRDSYIKNRISARFSTFAVLKDGKWFANGEMGWFASTHDESMSKGEWDAEYLKMIEALPEDTLLTLIDCHI